jgi:secreted trypsin-like serine protease
MQTTVKKPALLLSLLLVLLGASSAYAISYGQPDGTGHPSTGALVYFSPTRHEYRITCTGTLISPTVFLSAAHCTAFLEVNGITNVGVTFDPQFDAQTSTIYLGTMHTNPLYNRSQSDTKDIAVLTFAQPIQGITPVQLPPAGLLDQMKQDGSLKTARFTSVGYGEQEPVNGPGGKVYPFTADRRVSTGGFNSLTKTWLKLSGNPSHGDGGTCYGDSGGPQFLGGSNLQTSITITGDTVCRATNVDYRLDTPQARAFLGQFVALP